MSDMVSFLQDDLQRVEKKLFDCAQSSSKLATELSVYLIEAGGKRVRPSLCIVSSQVQDLDSAPVRLEVVKAAVAVELVHIGTLCHDDVMDNATTRRSVPSVNNRWGDREAILAGDYLLSRSGEVAAELGSEVASLIARTIAQLCEGQVVELESVYDLNRSESLYEEAIAGKTAVLLSASSRIGAMVNDSPQVVKDALEDFGYAYGMSFQIVDDILDIVATDEQLGKPAGNDLLEGVYTLPVIRALSDPDVGDELRDLLGHRIDEKTRDRACELIRSTNGVAEAREVAQLWASRAQAKLEKLPDTLATESLRTAADQLLDRIDSDQDSF